MSDLQAATGAQTSASVCRTGRAGRGRGPASQNRTGSVRRQARRVARTSSFKGATKSMNGIVSECFDEHSDGHQFAKTPVDALQGYCMKNLRFSEDLADLFADPMIEPQKLPLDNPGNNATKPQEALWTAKVKTYSKQIDTLQSILAATHITDACRHLGAGGDEVQDQVHLRIQRKGSH
ncbi:hypothetical protein MHU86_21052 [Fragilaria crotonensis]|nr:hypothetical protein MHU86_21052 [Fragilaria crotonensis]